MNYDNLIIGPFTLKPECFLITYMLLGHSKAYFLILQLMLSLKILSILFFLNSHYFPSMYIFEHLLGFKNSLCSHN